MHKPVVLIAEDDASLRTLLEFILTHTGFEVRLTSDGKEAVSVYRKEHEGIDVVLLDVLMPRATLKAMQDVNPEVNCCLTKGEGLKAPEGDLVRNCEAFLLEKPYPLAQLPQLLRQLMERQARKKTA